MDTLWFVVATLYVVAFSLSLIAELRESPHWQSETPDEVFGLTCFAVVAIVLYLVAGWHMVEYLFG